MDTLIRFGFSIEEIKNIMDTNIFIENSDNDISKLIDILKDNKCDTNKIRNIILCNPLYLSRKMSDINNLIDKLIEIGIKRIDILLDSNPYILNLNINELDNIIKEKKENIVNYLNNNIIY
jgi:hypothetical protein